MSDNGQKKAYDYFTKHYNAYRDSVLNGTRAAGMAERAKVIRQEEEVRTGVPGYRFDFEIGFKPLVWIMHNLKFPMGEKRGLPMKLADWQIYDTIVLFGWVFADNPTKRRFMDAFIEVARKNGKSTFIGAIIDYLAFGEVSGVHCYIAATSLDQAEETFIRAANALELAKGSVVNVSNSKNYKAIKYRKGIIRAIPAEPKDGKLAYGTVIDEYHQHEDNDLINSIHSGNVSDQQSMLLRITTAGTNITGVCHEEYLKCKKILDGTYSMPRYFVSIYEIDDEDSADDPLCWEKANPNWGVSIDPEEFKGIYEYSKTTERDMVDFKTKNLNKWCHSLTKWANMPLWQEKCRWSIDESTLVGRVAYGGLDLSAVYDFTAFTLDFPLDDGTHYQKTHFWIAEAQKKSIARQCRIPIDKWIANGWITATPGDVIDYDYVRDYISECYQTYKLMFIAADRWKIDELMRIMPAWFVDVAYEFSQGLKSMSPSIREYERIYLEGKVSDGGNEVIDWMMSCAELFQDSSGNVKLVKPKRRTESRIDGVITSVMALSNARTNDVGAISGEVSDMISLW